MIQPLKSGNLIHKLNLYFTKCPSNAFVTKGSNAGSCVTILLLFVPNLEQFCSRFLNFCDLDTFENTGQLFARMSCHLCLSDISSGLHLDYELLGRKNLSFTLLVQCLGACKLTKYRLTREKTYSFH